MQQWQSNAKQIPSSFTHFYCHCGSSNLKQILRFFSKLAGGSQRLGEIEMLKILLATRTFNLSGPPKNRTISGPCHLYFTHTSKLVLQTLRWCCVDFVIHHERDVREEQHHTYMWREQAIIEWSWHVNSIVAYCHSAKLCAYAARNFRSQQSGAVTRMWRSCGVQHSHKERAIGVVGCKKEGIDKGDC